MKKITAFALILTMLCSILAVNASAAGILVQSDFNDMNKFTQNFHAGAFYVEDQSLFGYDEAKCLQSKGEFYTYDTTIDVILADDDLSENKRSFSMWYPNTNLYNYGRYEGTLYMIFYYDHEEHEAFLGCADIDGGSEDIKLAGPIELELEDDVKYTFGISVTRGRIRCFLDNEMLFEFVDTTDKYLIGLQDESTVPTALVYWNEGNFIRITDVKISTAEFLFPMAPAGEVTTTTAAKPVETTTKISEVIVTDKDGNDVTDDSGNKVTETVIITDAPVADTNTGAVVGGNSTSTGDKAVIVVAAMIVALGSALIVRKVSVR